VGFSNVQMFIAPGSRISSASRAKTLDTTIEVRPRIALLTLALALPSPEQGEPYDCS
jgi:hypothetical protein